MEAGKWARALRALEYDVTTVAGAGRADHLLPGLAMGATEPPTAAEVAGAVGGADVVIVENLCSLPLNPPAAKVVSDVLRGRRAVLHHHDLAWQRPHLAHLTGFPPDDPAWHHVTINDLSRRQLSERGIDATTVPNAFDVGVAPGARTTTREALDLGPDDRLLLQPTRAIARKNVPAGVALAEKLGASYWLLGPAEEGYGPDLDRVIEAARCPVLRQRAAPEDAYAAADAVVLPSTWEGFGNATVESAVHRRPLAIGRYPVAAEIEAYGFRWFPADDHRPLDRWLNDPDESLLDHNLAIARRFFSLDALVQRLGRLLERART